LEKLAADIATTNAGQPDRAAFAPGDLGQYERRRITCATETPANARLTYDEKATSIDLHARTNAAEIPQRRSIGRIRPGMADDTELVDHAARRRAASRDG